jgi:hypothetical protein
VVEAVARAAGLHRRGRRAVMGGIFRRGRAAGRGPGRAAVSR